MRLAAWPMPPASPFNLEMMMSGEHTEGTIEVVPWAGDPCMRRLRFCDPPRPLCHMREQIPSEFPTMLANADRIRDCWNALEGIANPAAVREVIEAARGHLGRHPTHYWDEHDWALSDALSKLDEAEFDEADELKRLVAARTRLKPAELKCPRETSDMTPCVARDGATAKSDDGKCVGCGLSVLDLLTKERAKLDEAEPDGGK